MSQYLQEQYLVFFVQENISLSVVTRDGNREPVLL